MEEEDTAEEAAEVFTVAAVAADFMEVVEAGFTAVEVLAEEAAATLSAAGIRMAAVIVADMVAEDIEAATMVAAVTTVVTAATAGAAGATDGAAEVGATEEVGAEAGVGAGDLATAGRIGDMAGDIRMATTATRITRPTVILIRTRRMGLRMTT